MAINILTEWQSFDYYALQIPPALKPWIIYPGSFMGRLRDFNIMDAEITVVIQDWFIPEEDERKLLNLPEGASALIREVLIASPKHPWMYARTIFPRETLTENEEKLAHLDKRALGSVLFNEKGWVRGEFEVMPFTKSTAWHTKIAAEANLSCEELWGRRSMFTLGKKKLLLMEVFLPAIESAI
jgi:chorismate--pyruvate lyase